MIIETLERVMLKRLKSGKKIDPRVLARLEDDGGPVGAGKERIPAPAVESRKRTMTAAG